MIEPVSKSHSAHKFPNVNLFKSLIFNVSPFRVGAKEH